MSRRKGLCVVVLTSSEKEGMMGGLNAVEEDAGRLKNDDGRLEEGMGVGVGTGAGVGSSAVEDFGRRIGTTVSCFLSDLTKVNVFFPAMPYVLGMAMPLYGE